MSTFLKKYRRQVWALILLAVVSLHAGTLMRYPAPFVDEVWVTARALAFQHTGHALGPLDTGAENYPHAWVANQWLFTFLQSLFLRFSPVPSLLPVRIMGLVFGLILLGAAFWAGKQLVGEKASAIACLLLAFSTSFFYSAHSARYDIVAAALGYLGLAIYLTPGGNRFWRGFWAAILVSLAVETHLNSVVFVAGLLALLLYDQRSRLFRASDTWGICLGGLVGIGFFAGIHFFPDPQTYFTLLKLQLESGYAPPLAQAGTSWPAQALDDLAQTGRLILAACTSALILLIPGTGQLIQQKTHKANRLLLINVSNLLCFLFIIRNKTFFYAILIAPALFWIIGAFLVNFFQQPWRRSLWFYARQVIILGSVFGMAALSLAPLVHDSSTDYRAAQKMVDQFVQPGDRIMGSQTWWLGQSDHPYFSWEILTSYSRDHPGTNFEDAFEAYRPNLFIFDRHVLDFISDDPADRKYRLSRSSVIAWLNQHGEVIAEFNADTYGPFIIYRLNWEDR